jgi:putative SOS response-associated peptidase YedK
MCGRYTLRAAGEAVAGFFGLPEVPVLEPRYNIAPTQTVPIVRAAMGAGRELVMVKWGLIPSWATDPSIGNKMINARSETAATRPAFRSAMKQRRCLVVADGFYEWQKTGGKKQPYYIRLAKDGPFAFAGLWERWDKGEEPLESCTILTTSANECVAPVHDRMPVILDPNDYHQWLDPGILDAKGVAAPLRPLSAERMTAYPVTTLVNNPRNQDPKCVQPRGEAT